MYRSFSPSQAEKQVATKIVDCRHEEPKPSRLHNLYAALSQANQAIAQIRNRDALFEAICRIAIEHGRFANAWIDLFASENEHLKCVAAYENDVGICQIAVSSIDALEHECNGMTERAIRKNQPVICNSICTSVDRKFFPEMDRHGSIASFPTRRTGQPLGTLNLFSAERNFFDAASIDVLQQMTNDISCAVEKLERESQHKDIKSDLATNDEEFNSAILTASLDCIVSINQYGEIISFNHASELTFGYRSEDILGKKLVETLIPPEWRAQHPKGLARFFETGKSNMLNRRIELNAMRVDGSIFPIELAIVPLCVQNSSIFTAFIRDISERKQAEMLQLGQNRILNMVATGVPLAMILAEIIRFAESQFDHAKCTIRQANNDLSAPSFPSPSNASTPTCDTAMHGRRISFPIVGKGNRPLGTFMLHFCEGAAPHNKEEELSRICANLAGIAIERRAADERIRHLAYYDGLTTLPNRFLFKEYLDLALRNARRHCKKFAVLFLDLDGFKKINDTLGHDAGDQVLREIAGRLRDSLRHTDKIARMGGDEFYVLIEDLAGSRYAAGVAQKLLGEAARPIRIGNENHELSISIGIAIYPDDGMDGQELLKNADRAMYRTKERGKNGFRFFASSHETACDKAISYNHTSLLHRPSKKSMSDELSLTKTAR